MPFLSCMCQAMPCDVQRRGGHQTWSYRYALSLRLEANLSSGHVFLYIVNNHTTNVYNKTAIDEFTLSSRYEHWFL